MGLPPDAQIVSNLGLMLGLAHVSKDAVTDVVKRILGPTADHAGAAIASLFKKRTERVDEVLETSARMLLAAEAEPQPVPGRIPIPVLNHSSWEEDAALRQRWAALLANAATGGDSIVPAFAGIVRQFTPEHAAIVQWMFDQGEMIESRGRIWPDVFRKEIEAMR